MEATADDLTRPLGLDRKERPRRRLPLARLGLGALGAAVAALAVFVALVDDPLGGEPHVVVPIEIRAAAPPAPAAVAPAEPASRTASEVESASGVAVVRPGGSAAPAAIVIRAPEPEVIRLAPAPDPRLSERARHGALPKLGPDGARPLDVYARRATGLPGGAAPAGRVAILVTGLGIGQSATANAIDKLPPPVTLAFAPYGGDLERQVARAREAGHEVMLQVPMEPFDYPDNDPGPHTLMAQGKPAENLDRLHWAMTRFPGYVGLVNFMGGRLTADEAALAPILREVGARGLGFLDDGSSARSQVAAVAARLRVPGLRADLVLDGVPRSDQIDRELARLEEIATKRGLAVATASALPLTVERIARWSRELESRNILLVPVSTAFPR
ncbi:MAG TPA: divergent polysaccharide deacetylase family protein [Beijerinckiaceae bacterium]|nr:divergent polysaccharide deacetylase family protein [Beijerinckiaceae bacterium]